MNDRRVDAAHGVVEDALAELVDVQARMAALPAHAPCRAALALRAADLGHRIAAAARVLDAYAVPDGPAAEEKGDALPAPAPAAEAA